MPFLQAIECVLAGMGVGFDAFLKILPFYAQLKSITAHLFSAATGIPVLICSVIIFGCGFAIKCLKK